MLKVCKFGGSSLSDAKHFKQVKAIIESDPDRKCVIVSAPGKGEGEHDKITDLLYLCYQHRKYHVEFDGLFERIEQRYLTIKKELSISIIRLRTISRRSKPTSKRRNSPKPSSSQEANIFALNS